MSISIEVIDHTDDEAVDRFVELEAEFVASADGPPRYVAEPYEQTAERLSGRSPALPSESCRRRLLVARDGNDVVGRCVALVNEGWQRSADWRRKVGFIGWFAAAPDAAGPVREMLRVAEDWLRSQGMDRVIAGCNGHALNGLGILTDGFDDYEPMFPLGWNPPYYAEHFDTTGYARNYPWLIYDVDLGADVYRKFRKQTLRATNGARIRPVDVGRFAEEMEVLRPLFNEGFDLEWEMEKFSPEAFNELQGWMQPVLDPQMMWFGYADDPETPVGFCYGFPDWTPSFRRLCGATPTQAFWRELATEPVTRAGGIAYACLPEYRRTGLGLRLGFALYDHLQEDLGLDSALYYPVNGGNKVSRGIAERLGGQGRQLYDCFEKRL